MDNPYKRLHGIFAIEELRRRNELKGQYLVHYTSAENAMRIIENGEFWLRNARLMNDVSEVDHGIRLLANSLARGDAASDLSPGLAAINEALDGIFPNLSYVVIQQFNENLEKLRNQTFITCLSDVPNGENGVGRLSMWRNYTGGQTGVGILLKTALFQKFTDNLGVFSTPVAYHTHEDLNKYLLQTADSIKQNREFLTDQIGQEGVSWAYLNFLRSLSLGLKHPGFKEEREWRVFHTAGIDPHANLCVKIVCVQGIPQKVLQFNFEKNGLTHADLIGGLIIGPSQHQNIIADSLVSLLEQKGVPVDELAVHLSPIPLRV